MDATQQTQRRESTFLTLSPLINIKTATSAVDDANPLSPGSDVVPAVKTQRSASESSTSSDSSNRFLRLGHADADE